MNEMLEKFKKIIQTPNRKVKNVKGYQEKVYRNGWVPMIPPNSELLFFRIIAEDVNLDGANLDNYLFENLSHEYGGRIVEAFDKSSIDDGLKSLIKEIVESYFQQKYAIVIASSMPIIERLSGGESFKQYNKIKNELLDSISRINKTGMTEDFIRNKLFVTRTSVSECLDSDIINRHSISHAFDTKYNRKKALNCIILIDALFYLDTEYLINIRRTKENESSGIL